jgi:RNA polymerase sigma-70 factor (ECF subfamily)
MTDQEILQLIKEDNQKVITLVYKKYHDEFMRFVRKGYPRFDTDSAEDAYSEGIHALYRNIKNGKLVSLSCDLKTYLFQIGKYKVIDELNRVSRTGGNLSIEYLPPEEILELDYFEEQDMQIKKTRLLDEIVAMLTDPCKTLLTLFWYDQKRDSEIVALMKYTSTDTVKNQRARCMRTLKREYLTKLVDEKIITSEKRTQLLDK